ncbi:MAG TPA: endonuclease domain-containing protein [Xanthomonadaceae bacterium]|nr:endonuclease domain-containing protein [Xanthomonadaceae bacterium]
MRVGAKLELARRLRRTMTDAEQALWKRLRFQQAGHRFRRQHPIGPFVVDFACIARRLIVEVDGGQHLGSLTDERRDAFLRTEGYRVLRFWNTDVLQNIDGVLQVILDWLSLTSPHPDLPPQAGEGEGHP